ncbi:MAG: AbrB family transcriptional regulator [Rhizobiaceae bacterium]
MRARHAGGCHPPLRTGNPLFQRNLIQVALLYAAAIAIGYAASLLRVPLPWMIGPLLLAAIVSLADKQPTIPRITRPIGQLVVAASVGLFFTPAALTAVSQQIVPMLAVALLTIAAGFVAALVLMRIAHIDVVSASLASIPGGPVEMAALAARHGAESGTVAFAQILRIALLVLIIPPLLVAIDGEGADPATALANGPVDYFGALLLLAIALGGGFFLKLIGMTTPFFLGPLATTAAASAFMIPVSAPPHFVLAGAQVLLGVWLGSMFKRELFVRSPMLLVAVLASTAVLLLLTAIMALVISWMTGISWQTMVLATAPGSVTEMALTAKILDQEVALVTAYHVLRIFIILPLVPLIFALVARLAGRPKPN